MKIAYLLFHSLQIIAGEPDNFSARLDASAPIANAQINNTVNGVLSLAIDAANAKKSTVGCDRNLLANLLKDDLDRNFPTITSYLYRTIPFAGPVDFSKVPYLGKFPYGRTSYSPSAKVKVGEETFNIGLDKLDHFFSHGFLYWKIVDQNPDLLVNKINNALDLGIAQEDGPWGLKAFGVKSYADLSANYKGLSFWRDLLDGKPPLIVCTNNNFVLNKKFALENYFDESMDESVNCNSYATLEMLESIKTFTDQHKISCPISKASCLKFVKNYPPEIAKKILHPLCLGTGKSQIEKPSVLNGKDVIDGVSALLSGGGNLVDILFPPTKAKIIESAGSISK